MKSWLLRSVPLRSRPLLPQWSSCRFQRKPALSRTTSEWKNHLEWPHLMYACIALQIILTQRGNKHAFPFYKNDWNRLIRFVMVCAHYLRIYLSISIFIYLSISVYTYNLMNQICMYISYSSATFYLYITAGEIYMVQYS